MERAVPTLGKKFEEARIKDMKGTKLEDGKGISGKGRLTIARIDAMQNFYGRTIRDNEGDSAKMSHDATGSQT